MAFFFGANTSQGFCGFHGSDLYDPRDGWAAFLIKSGAGTGKATFMRQIVAQADTQGIDTVQYACSSDPDSLDAVVFPVQKVCIIDATAPHVIEPAAYGECEQLVPFGCCLRQEITLSQTAAWFEAADACAAAHARCCRFLGAAAGLLENNRLLEAGGMDAEKVKNTAARIVARECEKTGTSGGVKRRFFAVCTPKGVCDTFDSAAGMCPKLYAVEDEHGAVAACFMQTVINEATAMGQEVIVGYDAWSGQLPMHVLIPTCGVGFLCSDRRHTVDFPVYRRLHATRFADTPMLADKRQQMRFNTRAAGEMLEEAVKAAASAKAHHDRMEALHIAAMDWGKWRMIADEGTQKIWEIVKGSEEGSDIRADGTCDIRAMRE